MEIKNNENLKKDEDINFQFEKYNFLDLDNSYIIDEMGDDIVDFLREHSGIETLTRKNQIEVCEYQDDLVKEYVDSCGNRLPLRKIKFLVDFDDDYFDNPEVFTLEMTPFKCKLSGGNPECCEKSCRVLTKFWINFMKIQYGKSWVNDYKKYISKREKCRLEKNNKNFVKAKESLEESYKENERLIKEKYAEQIDLIK